MKNLTLILIFISSYLACLAKLKLAKTLLKLDSYSLLELESTDKVFVLNKMTSSQMEAIQPLEGALSL